MSIEITRSTIKDYMNSVTNPLCTVPEIAKRCTGKYLDSNDNEYQYVYRVLEGMVKANILFSCSTKNGGNVYILRRRVIAPNVASQQELQAALDELPF